MAATQRRHLDELAGRSHLREKDNPQGYSSGIRQPGREDSRKARILGMPAFWAVLLLAAVALVISLLTSCGRQGGADASASPTDTTSATSSPSASASGVSLCSRFGYAGGHSAGGRTGSMAYPTGGDDGGRNEVRICGQGWPVHHPGAIRIRRALHDKGNRCCDVRYGGRGGHRPDGQADRAMASRKHRSAGQRSHPCPFDFG